MTYNGAREKLNGARIRETASWRNDGTDASNLFRAWNEVGSKGLDDIERYARMEFQDGNWASLQEPLASQTVRGPSLLNRLSAALHIDAMGRKHFTRAVRAPATEVPFAGESEVCAESRPIVASALLLVTAEDCDGKTHRSECPQ